LEAVSYQSPEDREAIDDLGVPKHLIVQGAPRHFADPRRSYGHHYLQFLLYELAAVHRAELAPAVVDRLLEVGLATEVPATPWIAMHQDLAWTYKVTLCQHLARRDRLSLLTDQPPAHAVTGGSIYEMMGGGPKPRHIPFVGKDDDIAQQFVTMAFRVAVPTNLEDVAFDRILRLREEHQEEFDAWRAAVDENVASLQDALQGVQSPEILKARLEEHLRRQVTLPLEDLRRSLSDARWDLSDGVLNVKFEGPALLAAIGLAPLQPVLASGVGVAAAVYALARRYRKARHEATASPVSFLLSASRDLAAEDRAAQLMWLTI
jgi:hypothetical protein